jgi:DNA-binding CsgD family transcriptional regulator
MIDIRPRLELRGRRSECEALDRLEKGARAGRSGVLVLRGEPGIGKTALLEYLVRHRSDCRIARVVGVQADMELAFAGTHQLCGPLLDRLDHLPGPQRDAIGVAFGLRAGPAPDRFLVSLGVLGLLAEAAAHRPVLCVVDDAQWLDHASAQVLAFVARRLLAESVALVFAVREPGGQPELAGLPELAVEGLDDAAARALLISAITGRLDEQVVERIVAETRGNPLALLELPRGLSAAELAGGFGVPSRLSLSARMEESFLRRFRPLPADTQRLLLLAAADPIGEPMLLWRAAERLGLGVDVAAPAESAGLVEIGAKVQFRHPLVRSAVYGTAPSADRQRVHRALADATDAAVDPDRRAWHRAQAALGPDAAVADELERSADRAMARGGLAAAAAFLERAVTLSPEPATRARRALAAAEAKYEAGAPHAAQALLERAAVGPLDGLQSARLARLRGEIAAHLRRGHDAAPLLLDAAKLLEPFDVGLARDTYLEALWAATLAGGLGGGVRPVAEAALAAPPAQPPRASDVLLDGLGIRFTDGYAMSVPTLRLALRMFRDEDVRGEQEVHRLSLACRTAADLFDDETWQVLATRQVQAARQMGALSVLPRALLYLGYLRLFTGDFAAASAVLHEADAITDATGNARIRAGTLLLAAYRGKEAVASALIEAAQRDATARGEGLAFIALEHARAVLQNGLGRYDIALSAAQNVSSQGGFVYWVWTLPELVEAAARLGQPGVAAAALEQLSERARATGTPWALGLEARSRALMAEGQIAEELHREAIDHLGRSRVAVELARSHLVYGEWLRRERRRLDAREQLRTAHDLFADMGAEAFAERTRRELLATGERARRRAVDTIDQLTPQEAQIACLARDGYSNQEIGGQLFISPKTVEYHLGKAFNKLGISSRRQLYRVLPRD